MTSDNLQLIAITESNTDQSVSDAELCGPSGSGWSVLRRDRCARVGGGVLLAYRAPLHLERIPSYETTDGEDLWAKFQFHGHTLYVCVVYIPPRSSETVYTKWFDKVESVCSKHASTKVIIFGDLNLYSANINVQNYFKCFTSICNLEMYNCVMNANDRALDVVMTSPDLCGAVNVRAASLAEQLVKVDTHHPPLLVDIIYNFSKEAIITEPSNIPPQLDWNFPKGGVLVVHSRHLVSMCQQKRPIMLNNFYFEAIAVSRIA
ncbi:hypothetical protein NE865_06616 [Phthorimaea operculella]|nr:hypothetical protein NE865_06616 [Phthorimaea operculella]